MNKKIKAYFSHPITGKFGADCNAKKKQDYIKHNCKIAIEKAITLRQRFYDLHIYLPAESEPFVGRAHFKNYIDINKILEIDCEILENCDMLIIAPTIADGISGGMIKEILRACDKIIPIFVWNDYARIGKFIEEK